MNNFFCSLLVACLLLPGCRKQESPAITRTKADTVTGESDQAGDRSNKKKSNDDYRYQPIFTKNLAQETITNRMEQNFARYHDKMDKSGLLHFPSAGLLLYQSDWFEKSSRFSGFEFEDSPATIKILTNPFSMQGATRGLIAQAKNSGVLFVKDIIVDGNKGIFWARRKKVGESELATFTSAFGSDDFSWIITGTFQPDQEAQFGERLLKCVLNAHIAEQPRRPPGEDVDFTMRSKRLVLTDGFIDKLVFTNNGEFPDTETEPIFQAARSFRDFSGIDKLRMAEALSIPGPGFEITLLSSTNEVEIDGLKGYELVAVGKVVPNNEPLQMYSVSLFDDNAVYVMQGWVSLENPEDYIQEFRSLANSFERKK